MNFEDHESHQNSTQVWSNIEVLDCQRTIKPILVEVFGIHVELHANENQVEPNELPLTLLLLFELEFDQFPIRNFVHGFTI